METCCICFNDITSPTVCIPCDHAFCKRCIRRWRRQNNTCPQCRAIIDNLRTVTDDDFSRRRGIAKHPGFNFITKMTDRMKQNVVVLLFIIGIPLALVYIDAGVRFVGPTVKDRCNYVLEVSSNWTLEKMGIFFDTNRVTPFIQESKICLSAFLYDEISLISSIFELVIEFYKFILHIFSLATAGIQGAIWELFEVLKKVVMVLIPDLYHCISSILIYPIYQGRDLTFGLYECSKILLQFVMEASIPLGWSLFYACKCAVRLFIYSFIYCWLTGN